MRSKCMSCSNLQQTRLAKLGKCMTASSHMPHPLQWGKGSGHAATIELSPRLWAIKVVLFMGLTRCHGVGKNVKLHCAIFTFLSNNSMVIACHWPTHCYSSCESLNKGQTLPLSAKGVACKTYNSRLVCTTWCPVWFPQGLEYKLLTTIMLCGYEASI